MLSVKCHHLRQFPLLKPSVKDMSITTTCGGAVAKPSVGTLNQASIYSSHRAFRASHAHRDWSSEPGLRPSGPGLGSVDALLAPPECPLGN